MYVLSFDADPERAYVVIDQLSKNNQLQTQSDMGHVTWLVMWLTWKWRRYPKQKVY